VASREQTTHRLFTHDKPSEAEDQCRRSLRTAVFVLARERRFIIRAGGASVVRL
jgi:hypothetical protein